MLHNQLNETKMIYSNEQLERAKKMYNSFFKFETLADYDVENIGLNTANQRMDYHNSIIASIKEGNKSIEKEWKMFFIKEVLKSDQKQAESKAKLTANKEASSDILAPIKEAKRLVEFGKWLNTSGNSFRKEHFNKKYTAESVRTFLVI